MVHDSGIHSKAYQGYLRKDRPTVAEILKDDGRYRTLMVGKWHVGGEYPPNDPEHWKIHAGDETHPTPFQRGFQGKNYEELLLIIPFSTIEFMKIRLIMLSFFVK